MDSNIIEPWPLYFKEMLHVANRTHHVGIITLWSRKEIYIEGIDPPKLYNTIGQLYSREEGINVILRNLAANRYITDLVVVGVNLNHCAEPLIDFFKNGVDENHKVVSEYNSEIDKEIPKEEIELLRRNIKLHDLREYTDLKEINLYLRKIPKREPYAEAKTYPKAEIKQPDYYPSDHSGFIAKGNCIGDVWIDILKLINRFGYLKKTEYGDNEKELVSLMAVIKEEDPGKPEWKEYFEFTKKELEEYIPQVTSAKEIQGVEYTYGQRLMNFKGIDQIEKIVKHIKEAKHTRRAVAVLWDVEKDIDSPKCPCLDLIQGLVQEDRLYFTCYFRSNDMFEAWPRNAFALRKLQKMVCEKTELQLGNLIIISDSAHIYERHFRKAEDIVEKYQEQRKLWVQDPYGTILIEVDDISKEIVVKHLSPEGKRLDDFKAKTAIEAYKRIASQNKISRIEHALDIGTELQKAEIALKLGKKFVQDKVFEI